jgi:hypothetical protein
MLYAGLDLSRRRLDVHVLDEDGRTIEGEDVPDGFGELAGEIDPGDLRAALPAEAPLHPLVAVPTVGIPSRVGGGLDQRPAQVLRPVLRQWPTDIAVARLSNQRAQSGIPGELLTGSRTGGCRRSRRRSCRRGPDRS